MSIRIATACFVILIAKCSGAPSFNTWGQTPGCNQGGPSACATVENAGKVLQEILNAPDSIPHNLIDKSVCVVVLPSVKKFAIGIGRSYGRGVMTCRGGKDFQGKWGAATMMALEGASDGLQLGGEATDFILL